MKNFNADKIPHLLKVTANLFQQIRNETKAPNNNPSLLKKEGLQMHFITKLLMDLVEIVHPTSEFEMAMDLDEEDETSRTVITNVSPLDPEAFKKALESIDKIVKNQKPPKGGIEF